MGWENSHLHNFVKGRKVYEHLDNNKFAEDDGSIDYHQVSLSNVLTTVNDKIFYMYDFGDSWEHELKLTDIIEGELIIHPVCIDGENCGPPEDCGGVFGYRGLLKTLGNKNSPDYEETIDWLGGEFDPTHFDLVEVNEHLKEEDFGCNEIF